MTIERYYLSEEELRIWDSTCPDCNSVRKIWIRSELNDEITGEIDCPRCKALESLAACRELMERFNSAMKDGRIEQIIIDDFADSPSAVAGRHSRNRILRHHHSQPPFPKARIKMDTVMITHLYFREPRVIQSKNFSIIC